MSEMRYKKTKTSKVPLIILIVVLVLVIAAIVFVIFFMNSSPKQPQTASTAPSTAAQTTLSADASNSQATQPNQESTSDNNAQQPTEKVVVPTVSGGEQGDFFNATFTPTSAIDTLTGNSATLKEVFGTSYSGGAYTFNDDGTFSESISLTSVNSGAYAIEGDTLVATYTNDKNIFFEISKWDGDVPSELILRDYGGFDVYFS